MTSRRALLVILALLLGAQGAGPGAVPGEDQSTLCGRVVAVTCEGPASPVTLHLVNPQGSFKLVGHHPPEQRQLFGSRIENRYEQRLVCVPTATSTTNGQRVLVKETLSRIVVKDVPGIDSATGRCRPVMRPRHTNADTCPRRQATLHG